MPLPEPAATRSVLAPAPWSRWLWVGLAAVAALTALDVAVDRQVVLAGALAAVALAVGLLGHRGDALVVGAAALVAALGATAWDAGDATEQAIAVAVTATAGVTAFVTAVLRDAAAASARQFALLRGLAELADGASSVETTIDRVLDLLVPAVADVCALDLVIDHEQVRLGARVAGGEGGELEQALLRRRPAPRSVGAGTARGAARPAEPAHGPDHRRAPDRRRGRRPRTSPACAPRGCGPRSSSRWSRAAGCSAPSRSSSAGPAAATASRTCASASCWPVASASSSTTPA